MSDLVKFQKGFCKELFSSYGDSQFDTIRTVTNGMSGVKTAKLLNFATSCLEKDELYFEIGVLTGYTMISAGLGQCHHIIGVDDSSEFGDNSKKLSFNFSLFPHPNYQFIKSSFRNIGLAQENEKKTGVLYIDGKHDYKEVMDSLVWAENKVLSDKSLIFLDDTSVKGVSEAINDWLKDHPSYETIFSIKPYSEESSGLWSHDLSIGLGLTILKREIN